MFGIGPTELIVILVIALLVLGPKRLPELAHSLGKGLAEFRRATADLSSELDSARNTLDEEARKAAKSTAPDRRVSRSTPAQQARPAQPEAAAGQTESGEAPEDAVAHEPSEADQPSDASVAEGSEPVSRT